MAHNIEISGGAGPELSAAIAAVIAGIESEEKAALATARRPIHRSQWIEVSRPLEHLAPISPTEYAKRPGQAPEEPAPI